MDVGKLWILTNFGWCPEKVMGNRNKNALVVMKSIGQPIDILVTKCEVGGPLESNNTAVGAIHDASEIDEESVMNTVYFIEIEIPPHSMDPYVDKV